MTTRSSFRPSTLPKNEAAGHIAQWLTHQRSLIKQNPHHRVGVDVGMESVRGIHPTEILSMLHGKEAPRTLAGMAQLDLSEVIRVFQSEEEKPIGGAGGLGIIEETIGWTAARHGEQDNYGLVCLAPLHIIRRRQSFNGNRQVTEQYTVAPERDPDYLPLGEVSTVTLHKKEVPVQTWLYTGFRNGGNSLLTLRLSVPGVTDRLYPPFYTQENFDQMQVLGQGGFRLCQKLGIIGVDKPLASLVIGHDGHTALFKFNLFLHFLDKFGSQEAALKATRMLCAATIHAPQNGTVPRTTGDMVLAHYSKEHEEMYGYFGSQQFERTNALYVEMRLSEMIGTVSPIHTMVTEAEEKAARRAFSNQAKELLPPEINSSDLTEFPDTLDVESWLGMGTALTLDSFVPGWRRKPGMLGQRETIDSLSCNLDFRRELVEAYDTQENHLLGLLDGRLDRRFGVAIPENALIFASLRRATAYKINLISAVLNQHETYSAIGRELGRPIFWLFGGLAHQDDTQSIDALQNLLSQMERINEGSGLFKTDFLHGYSYDRARFIFPGLPKRGCWVGNTNPFDNRSQGTEAFGPSYLKATMNGVHILGTFDGGAGCLRQYPTVLNFGPVAFAGNTSFHNDMWNNEAIVKLSRFLLANGFIGAFEKVSSRLHEDMLRFESRRGAHAPGLGARIESMARAIAGYNGRVLMNKYFEQARRG
ncbi:MAG: hypothetical protein ABIH56_06380 [Candidatus Margulisiibacteriota bacterium]